MHSLNKHVLSHMVYKVLLLFIIITLLEVYIASFWTNITSVHWIRGKKQKWSSIRQRQSSYEPYLSDPVIISPELQAELNRRLLNATDEKIILIYISGFGVEDRKWVDKKKCGNCEITYDRKLINDERTGAVVFHYDRLGVMNVPWKRNPRHLYVLWTMESTLTMLAIGNLQVKFMEYFKFNATLTYRRDSDFQAQYGNSDTVASIIKTNNLTLKEIYKRKKKVAVAVVSDCDYTPGAVVRLKQLKELSDYGFGLECYGSCFGGKIFTDKPFTGFNGFISEYKFYFSFENSYHCRDYITEKFFVNGLKSLAVPVVWGPRIEEYMAVSPPGSFIHADSFASLKELADYIKYLDKNETAYLEYFRWLYMDPKDLPQYGKTSDWCQLCRALHGINIDELYNPLYNESKIPIFTNGVAPRTVDDTIDWLYGREYTECVDPFWDLNWDSRLI
uniref:4-galactosyl-N-acetylglucosaminide 3-alpha-L-fucosyltransferase 9-like isoform X1 n=1 Tax=Styela clava TaxID=7725 RepID=UPI00193A363C|nr:4-galactosyl-N-acetylglucosaminide 3-alpha-L-fucosyltransferase 9-like isoform X1 [Styela clava]